MFSCLSFLFQINWLPLFIGIFYGISNAWVSFALLYSGIFVELLFTLSFYCFLSGFDSFAYSILFQADIANSSSTSRICNRFVYKLFLAVEWQVRNSIICPLSQKKGPFSYSDILGPSSAWKLKLLASWWKCNTFKLSFVVFREVKLELLHAILKWGIIW